MNNSTLLPKCLRVLSCLSLGMTLLLAVSTAQARDPQPAHRQPIMMQRHAQPPHTLQRARHHMAPRPGDHAQRPTPRPGDHARHSGPRHDNHAQRPTPRQGDHAQRPEHGHGDHAQRPKNGHDDHVNRPKPGDHAKRPEHGHDDHAKRPKPGDHAKRPEHGHDDHAKRPEHGHEDHAQRVTGVRDKTTTVGHEISTGNAGENRQLTQSSQNHVDSELGE